MNPISWTGKFSDEPDKSFLRPSNSKNDGTSSQESLFVVEKNHQDFRCAAKKEGHFVVWGLFAGARNRSEDWRSVEQALVWCYRRTFVRWHLTRCDLASSLALYLHDVGLQNTILNTAELSVSMYLKSMYITLYLLLVLGMFKIFIL